MAAHRESYSVAQALLSAMFITAVMLTHPVISIVNAAVIRIIIKSLLHPSLRTI